MSLRIQQVYAFHLCIKPRINIGHFEIRRNCVSKKKNLMIDYKVELEPSDFKNLVIERDLGSDESYFILKDFFSILEQTYDIYHKNPSILNEKMSELYETIKNKAIPLSESVFKSSVLDFCLDRYERAKQDSESGLYALKIIHRFVKMHSQYRVYIAKDFLKISQESIGKMYAKYISIEIDILDLLVKDKATCHYFSNYDLQNIFNNIVNIEQLKTLTIVYDFLSDYLQMEEISVNAIQSILEFFIYIKNKNYYAQYEFLNKRWPQILNCLIRTEFFDPDLFFQGSLFDFYEKNYCNPNYILDLGAFYSFFIYKFPGYRMNLTFNFEQYFDLIQNLEENQENDINDKIKQCVYCTLSDYLFLFDFAQQKEEEKGKQIVFDFHSFIHNIPINFLENKFFPQIFADVNNGTWNTKLGSLCLLSTFACIRPDIILDYMKPVQYFDLFCEFIHEFFIEKILNSFLKIFDLISKNQNFKEILDEIAQTETYQNICNLLENQEECKEDVIHLVQMLKENFV